MKPLDVASVHAALFDSSFDGLLVVDEKGTIVLANPAITALTGFPPENLVGFPVETLLPQRFGDHAALRSEYWRHLTPRVMGKGMSLFVRHADGIEIPVDISLNVVRANGRNLVAAAVRDLRGRSYAPDTIRVQATALHAAANGIVITDPNGVITWVNPAVCRMTGYGAHELVGQHTRLLKSGVHDPTFYADLWASITRGETWSGTIANRRKDGTLYHEEQTIAPIVDERGKVTHFVAIKQDVTRQVELQEAVTAANAALKESLAEVASLTEQLREEAIRDVLTNLHNRRFFDESAPALLDRAVRDGAPVSITILDLDHFKDVNDRYGHAEGDAVLRRFGAILRNSTRKSDLVCRFGGEEFIVAMPGATATLAQQRAEEWRRELTNAATAGAPGAVSCTVSAGVAQHRQGETLTDTVARADRALYEAKADGRNCVRVAG